jgi:hypothetical protein
LIDGQQRLTTITLLMAALRDHIEESGWSGAENDPMSAMERGVNIDTVLERFVGVIDATIILR